MQADKTRKWHASNVYINGFSFLPMLIRTYACVSATEEWVLPSKLHTTRKQLLSCTYLNNCTVQTSCNNFLSNCHFITSVIKEADESKKKNWKQSWWHKFVQKQHWLLSRQRMEYIPNFSFIRSKEHKKMLLTLVGKWVLVNRFLHDKTNIHSYQLVYFCKTLKQSIHMHTYLKHLKTVQQQTYMHSYQMNLSQ